MVSNFMVWVLAVFYVINAGLLFLNNELRLGVVSLLFAVCTGLIFME